MNHGAEWHNCFDVHVHGDLYVNGRIQAQSFCDTWRETLGVAQRPFRDSLELTGKFNAAIAMSEVASVVVIFAALVACYVLVRAAREPK